MAESVAAHVLPLAAAVLWAGSIVVTKRALVAGATPLQATLASAAVNTVLYWSGVAVLLVLGRASLVVTPTVVAAFLASGLLGTTGARLVSNHGIERLGASINTAGVSTRPLFATILALVVLGEAVRPSTAAGVVLLVGGVILLSLSRGGNVQGWSRATFALPLFAAMLFAGSDVLRRFGLTAAPITALQGVAIHEAAGLLGLATFALVGRGREVLSVPERTYRPLLLGGALFGGAMLLFVEALRVGRVAVVTTLAGTAPLFVVGLSYLFLREIERITRTTIVATVTIVLGGGVIVLW